MCTRGAKISFSISSIIREYNEYKDVWEAIEGELLCQRENKNYHDPFSVVVVTVGHVPKKS